MLNILIDTMLPGDHEMNLPSASMIKFDDFIIQSGKSGIVDEFYQILYNICNEKFGINFQDLTISDRLIAINKCKASNIKVFAEFVNVLFAAYYSNAQVLNSIGSGSVPPFPDGNVLEGDDWSILEQVFERGKCYRHVE